MKTTKQKKNVDINELIKFLETLNPYTKDVRDLTDYGRGIGEGRQYVIDKVKEFLT